MIFKHHMFLLVCGAILLLGCQTVERRNTPTLLPNSPTLAKTLLPTLTPSKTGVPFQTSTASPTVMASPIFIPSSTPTPTLAPGATQLSPVDGMLMVYMPGGEFQMGSRETDNGADYDEFPQHPVNLDAYWVDQTVVSNAMYAVFLNDVGNQIEGRTTWLDTGDEDVLIYQRDGVWEPLKGYENYPIVEVTWFGAQAYCHWAGKRLPTEAEWEYAARGNDGRIYPWGDEIDCDMAQYANCGGGLLPVGNRPAGASPYGVLGLSGNTWEWVADWYAADYYAISPVENPIGPEKGETRVLRGASWEYDWKHLRAANRRHNGPAVSMHDYSFRCVLSE